MSKVTLFQDSYEEYVKELTIQCEKAMNKIKKNIYQDIKDIMKEAADAFYNDYPSPRMYVRHKRKPTLANMYKIIEEDGYLYVLTGGEFSTNKHRIDKIDPDYIYEHMFKGGWHGGAVKDKNPDSLWYSRWHGNFWEPYVYPAERMNGDTPYEIFVKKYEKYKTTGYLQMAQPIIKKYLSDFL